MSEQDQPTTEERIEGLEDIAEEVERISKRQELLDERFDEIRARVSDLEDVESPDGVETRLTDVENRVEAFSRKLENVADAASGSASHGGGDNRDEEVLAHLEPGQTVTSKQLRKLYRKTNMKNPSSISERLEGLTQTGPFERVAVQKWRYVPE